jgi:predicted PurR-regulated permease PerM
MSIQPSTKKRAESEPHDSGLESLLEFFQSPFRIHSIALSGLFILAVFYTLYLAREFFLPVILAFLFSLLLAPAVRGLKRVWIPEPLGAAIVLFFLLAVVGYGAYKLSGPASSWIRKAPEIFRGVESKLAKIKKPVDQVNKATEQVEKLTSVGKGRETQKVELEESRLGAIFSGTQVFLAEATLMVVLLYFLLASGDLFLRKMVHVLPRFEDKKRAVEISRQMEDDISTYLVVVSIIGAGKGVAVGMAMYFIGMPNPLLWGVMVAVLNFIPYLGALIVNVILTLVALMTFEDIVRILSVPAITLVIDIVEAYLVTPFVVGKRLTLNPVVLFLWLIFWGWLWGVAGALIAVPLLASFKIVCDRIEELRPVGEFISA